MSIGYTWEKLYGAVLALAHSDGTLQHRLARDKTNLKQDTGKTSVFAIIVLMKDNPIKGRIVTVSSKGQITIPQDLRTRLGIQPGDKVYLWVEKGGMRVRPVKHPRIA
jgi:AbrB family looped-hinge helix DNA binding protein